MSNPGLKESFSGIDFVHMGRIQVSRYACIDINI